MSRTSIIHHSLQLMISHDHTQESILTPFTFMLIVHMEDNAHTKFFWWGGGIYLLFTCFSVFACLCVFAFGIVCDLCII